MTTPGRFAGLLLTRPGNLRESDAELLRDLTAACPEMRQLAGLVGEFGEFLVPGPGNDTGLTAWIAAVRASELSHHNGRTGGVSTRTKRIMRQMHGRAGFHLLRHRVLLP
jgi:hypothetical protein